MNRIQELAKRKGITLRELAEIINCSDVQMQRYVHGAEVAPIHAKNLERYFGEPIDQIAGKDKNDDG